MELVKWNKAKQAIIEAKTVDEVKSIRDKAEAMRAYAKQIGESLDVQNDICEIKLRAERRMGEMLKEMPNQRGKSKMNTHDGESFKTDIVKDLELKHYERYEAIADLPEESKVIKEVKSFFEYVFFINAHPTIFRNKLLRLYIIIFSLPICLCCCIVKKRHSRIFGMYADNKLIAMIAFDKRYSKIYYLFVKENYRKHNIATELVNYADCFCVSAQSNTIDFWNKQGYNKRVNRCIFVRGC